MKTELSQLGIVPVTTRQLASLYPQVALPQQRVRLLERDGRIIRLKKGLYVVSPRENEQLLSTELIANHIYAPSYVSMHTALRFYGLIPEAVYLTQSMTVKASRTFENSLGRFDYTHVSREVFHIGVTIHQTDGIAFTIATPEKALCDLIAHTHGLNLRYVKDVATYLEQDLRLDMDALPHLDLNILKAYASVGKKAQSINTLIKFLDKTTQSNRHNKP